MIVYGDAKKGIDLGTEKGLIKAAIMVQAQAKALADFSQGYQTGRTRASISYKTTTASDGDLRVSPKDKEAYVGTNVDYAPHIEFGTRKQAAQPFLRPAVGVLGGGQNKVVKIMNDAMKQSLSKGKKIV